MAFVLIDGVIANDTFSTAAAGTSSLVDGINNQQFSTPASATAQPVDAVLLFNWSSGAPTPVTATISWTQESSKWSINEISISSSAISQSSGSDVWAVTESSKLSGSIAWTNEAQIWALNGSSLQTNSISWTSHNDAWSIVANIATSGITADIAWTQASDTWSLLASSQISNEISITSGDDIWSLDVVYDVVNELGAAYDYPIPKRKKYLVKIGESVLVFSNKDDAVSAINQEEKQAVEPAIIAQSIEVDTKPKEVVINAVEVHQKPKLYDVSVMLKTLQQNAEIERLIADNQYKKVIAAYEQFLDDEEVELLLMAM